MDAFDTDKIEAESPLKRDPNPYYYKNLITYLIILFIIDIGFEF